LCVPTPFVGKPLKTRRFYEKTPGQYDSVRGMNRRAASLIIALLGCAGALVNARQQLPGHDSSSGETRLLRTFSADTTSQYLIQLTVRSELTGDQPETIGAKTYVHPFARSAGRTVAWRAVRHVLSVGPDGTAGIEESLEDFTGVEPAPLAGGDPELAKLERALGTVLENWIHAAPIHLRYRETAEGQLQGLDPAGVPRLEEADPPLLALWLLRALRPTAPLPQRPIALGERWQEPRAIALDGWSGVQAFESGEWLVAPQAASLEPAARLLVVQQLLGKIVAGPERPPEGSAQGSFHGESLVTFSLMDGRLLAATRSATREVTWTLAPVAGLERAPQFAARLSAQVEIEECHGPCSVDSSRHSLRSHR
jgi:hypothetical protein